MTTYTHGHAEAVLRSHRWRTAANSAAYLLPHLRAGPAAARRRLGPGHDHRRPGPGWSGEVVALEVTEEAAALTRAELDRQGITDGRRGRGRRARARPRRAGGAVRRRARPPGAPARRRPGRGAARDAARDPPGGLVAARDSDYGHFAWHPARRGPRPWLELYRRGARQRWRARRRPAGCSPGRTRPARGTVERRLLDVVLRRRRGAGLVGRACGPTGSTSTALARQLVAQGRATRRSWRRSPTAWRAWAGRPRRLVLGPARRGAGPRLSRPAPATLGDGPLPGN